MDELILNVFYLLHKRFLMYNFVNQRIYLVYILIHFLVSVNAQITISISIKHYKTKYLDHNGGCRCIDTCKDALLWEGAILSSDAGKLMISFNVKFFIQKLLHILCYMKFLFILFYNVDCSSGGHQTLQWKSQF